MPSNLPINGRWQLPALSKNFPFEAALENFVAIDTETTGLHFHKSYPGFQTPSRPFCISAWRMTNLGGGRWNQESKAWIVPVDPFTRAVSWPAAKLQEFLKFISRYKCWVFHNGPFDLKSLRSIGVDMAERAGKAKHRIEDTLAAAHVLDSGDSHKLKDLAIRYLNILDTDEDVLIQRVKELRRQCAEQNIPTGPEVGADYWLPAYFGEPELLENYALLDVRRTALLWALFHTVLHKEGLWQNYVRERQVMLSTDRMTQYPVTVLPRIHSMKDEYENIRDQNESTVKHVARQFDKPDINIRSTKQLAEFLHGWPYPPHGHETRNLRLPIISETPGGSPSTSKETLSDLLNGVEQCLEANRYQSPSGDWRPLTKQMHWLLESQQKALSATIEYRRFNTAVTYLDGYLERAIPAPLRDVNEFSENWRDQVVHFYELWPNSNPWGTVTTRFSSSDPNAQNVGRDSEDISLRSAFGPLPGWVWYTFDYNQLELRLMARASGDPVLLRILNDGVDRHQLTADAINVVRETLELPPITRKIAKNINFAWQYGASSRKLSLMAGIPADDFNEQMRTAYPGVVAFMDKTIREARRAGYVQTLFGYRLYVPRDEPYKGTNYIIQGTAGDVCKNSMIAADEYIDRENIREQCRLILTVHDELIFAARKRLKTRHLVSLQRILASAGDPIGCPTPVEAKIVREDWGHPEPLQLGVAV